MIMGNYNTHLKTHNTKETVEFSFAVMSWVSRSGLEKLSRLSAVSFLIRRRPAEFIFTK